MESKNVQQVFLKNIFISRACKMAEKIHKNELKV
jgi:hypothetical protein